MIINDTSFNRFSALAGYNKNQNLDMGTSKILKTNLCRYMIQTCYKYTHI